MERVRHRETQPGCRADTIELAADVDSRKYNAMREKFLILFLVVMAAPGLESTAATFSLVPVADTSIYEGAPDNNLGGHGSVAAGGNASGVSFRALLKFDVAGSLPPEAIIQSASLQLTIVKSPGASVPSTFTLHRVLKDWGGGDKGQGVTGIGALAGDGEATWRARLHSSALWEALGGQSGVDFASAASAASSGEVQSSGTADFASTSDLTTDVRLWHSNPGNNFGWLLKSEAEDSPFTARRFGSSEGASGSPTLTIEALIPPRIGPTLVANGQISLRFDGEVGKGYVVESRGQVNGGEWTVVTNIPPLEASGPINVAEPLASSNRFYRVGEFQVPALPSGN